MPRVKRRKSGEGVEYLTCRLCGRAYESITGTHLVWKHEFDPEHPILEYRRRFRLPTADCVETRKRRRDSVHEWLTRQGRRLGRRDVLRLLRAERAAGRSLNIGSVAKRFHPLLRSACRHFGSWRNALRAAGLAPEQPRIKRIWTRETVLARIRALPPSLALNKVQTADPRLFQAGYRLFGSWPAAVKAAGRPYPPPGGPWKWTNERIFDTIRDRVRRGKSIRYSVMGLEHPGLVDAALDRFGSWRAAVAAASCEKNLPSERTHWPREELRTLLRYVREERGSVTYQALARVKRPGFVGPIESVERHFGTLSRARLAMGLPRIEWRPRVWTRGCILDFIRARARRELPIGLGAVCDRFGGLAAAARREFGSWRKAVECLGLGHLIRPQVFRWTRDRIVREIERIARTGGSLDQKEVRDAQPGTERAAVKQFGSWEAAVRAAGWAERLTPRPRHWSRGELVPLLRSYWRKFGRLSSEVIKRHKRKGYMGPLYSITKVFGSFPAAKRAAGLGHVPSHLPRRWHRNSILDELRSRARRPAALGYTALEREVKGLIAGARREFGSLRAAFRSAGVAPFDGRRKNALA